MTRATLGPRSEIDTHLLGHALPYTDTSVTPSQLPLIGWAAVFTWIPCGPQIRRGEICVTGAKLRLWVRRGPGGQADKRRAAQSVGSRPSPLERKWTKARQGLGTREPCFRAAVELLPSTEGTTPTDGFKEAFQVTTPALCCLARVWILKRGSAHIEGGEATFTEEHLLPVCHS